VSILEGSASQQARATGSRPHSDRLRVITAGRVGNMDARLGTSGFVVVASAETEDALMDAVSGDDPDAIVVEADLCDSLEHVRDLAPDAVVIAVGDRTPAGALGRVERGMSGTAMAGLLHALVAEGVGAAVMWGLVPTFRAGALHVPQRVGLSLLSAKADLVREHLANALRDPGQLVATAGTVALTVSASLLVSLSVPRAHERPEPVPVPPPTVERVQQHPVVAASATTSPADGPSRNDREARERSGQNRDESRDQGRHADQGENRDDNDQGENQDNADQGGNEETNDQGENQDNADQGGNAETNDQGENQDSNDQGGNQENNDRSENQDSNDQGGNQSTRRPPTTRPSVAFGFASRTRGT
jgi:hypothetical protein